MKIFPAIDLLGGKAVRLKKGDYNEVTVYSDCPPKMAESFKAAGAEWIHVVDLDGARDGSTANFATVSEIAKVGLKVEIGGGIRSLDTVEKYIAAGVSRVIIGTAAVSDPEFLKNAIAKYGEKIAVGVDIKDGMVAIKGWKEISALECFDFCEKLQSEGVSTVICTDISKDGMLSGTNTELYRKLSERFTMDFVASGGVSTIDDVRALASMGMYGAIVGKAIYTGNIDLKEAIAEAEKNGN